MTHDEHLAVAKAAARIYLEQGEGAAAVAAICSDLAKHPDWRGGKVINVVLQLFLVDPTLENARRLVEGFR